RNFGGGDFERDIHRNLAEETQVLLRQLRRCVNQRLFSRQCAEVCISIFDQIVEFALGKLAIHEVFTLSREVKNKEPPSSKMAPRKSFCWLIITSQRSCKRTITMSSRRRSSTSESGICKAAITQLS